MCFGNKKLIIPESALPSVLVKSDMMQSFMINNSRMNCQNLLAAHKIIKNSDKKTIDHVIFYHERR